MDDKSSDYVHYIIIIMFIFQELTLPFENRPGPKRKCHPESSYTKIGRCLSEDLSIVTILKIMAGQPTPPDHVPPPRNKGLIRPY